MWSFPSVVVSDLIRYLPQGRCHVAVPCREREVSVPQQLSGRCDCGPPRGHRDGAKRAVRLGGDEMALDVEGVVGHCPIRQIYLVPAPTGLKLAIQESMT